MKVGDVKIANLIMEFLY